MTKHGFFGFIVLVIISGAGIYFVNSKTRAQELKVREAKLVLQSGSFVNINNKRVSTDTEVPSGTLLETFDDKEVEVLINPVGKLVLAENSKALLTYNGTEAYVVLQKGCAVLYIEKAMTGSIKTDERTKTVSEAKERTSLEVCSEKRIGGVLLWSAVGAPAAGILLLNASGTAVKPPEVASVSRAADIR